MSDCENESAGDTGPGLLETAAQMCVASDLLDFAAQLSGLAEDLKVLAAKPIQPPSNLIETGDLPEASPE
ncbi:hypothetical protein [Sinorhizobium meliloti]|uniref:hypothetical protein n=1 Tax=Rhizobium meliloti TaxID=382 RepID=UPI001F3E2333|nr:hypothetical protein [Sinorhizobium meliloti]